MEKIKVAGLIVLIVGLIIIFPSVWVISETTGLSELSGIFWLTIGIILTIIGLVGLLRKKKI